MRRRVMIATVAFWMIAHGLMTWVLVYKDAPAANPADYETFASIRFLALIAPQLLFTVPGLCLLLLVEHSLLRPKPDQKR
jgi:hypothetical protein